MLSCRAIVDEGLAEPDPWDGFCLVIEKICELHARNRGFTAAFMSAFPDAVDFPALRQHALSSASELARRTKDAGHLRADFVLDDLILVLAAAGHQAGRQGDFGAPEVKVLPSPRDLMGMRARHG